MNKGVKLIGVEYTTDYILELMQHIVAGLVAGRHCFGCNMPNYSIQYSIHLSPWSSDQCPQNANAVCFRWQIINYGHSLTPQTTFLLPFTQVTYETTQYVGGVNDKRNQGCGV